MFEASHDSSRELSERLVAQGYWPARAEACIAEKKYSRAVEICRENLKTNPKLVSLWLTYARALYYAGQVESAEEQFHHVLALDSDNGVALKFLGDICFAAGDEITAMANYHRVLQLDPECRELASKIERRPAETTRTIKLVHQAPEVKRHQSTPRLKPIPFYTETVGDLYLAQGHLRMASEVFRSLASKGTNIRIEEKLTLVEKKIQEKEK